MTQPKRLRMVLYGYEKIGKSSLAETAPGPRLILDAEGGTEFLLNPQTVWADVNQAPPTTREDGTPLGPDDSVVLFVGDWRTFTMAHQWLRSGKHPFVSVVLDSLTELQKRCKDTIQEGGVMDQRAWGRLLDEMEGELRRFRDLTKLPTNPLWCVVLVALIDNKDGIYRSMVQGSLSKTLGAMYDVIGVLQASDPDHEGVVHRELRIGPNREFATGDRTRILSKTFGPVVKVKDIDRPEAGGVDLTDMMAVLNPGGGA